MARRKTQEEFAEEPLKYFSHDAHASQDVKCQRLIMRCDVAGYGRWWMLCELLASTRGHCIEFATEEDQIIVSRALGFRTGAFDELSAIEQARDFINELLSIGLLKRRDDGRLFSERMLKNAEKFGVKRAAGSKGGSAKRGSAKDDGG